MPDRTDSDSEHDQGPSWRAHALELRPPERRRNTDPGHTPYDVPLLTRAFEWPSPDPTSPPQLSPIEPSPTPTIDPSGRVSAPTAYADPRLLRPPHYPDSQYGRHRSAPLYGADDWDRRASFGPLPPPGTHPEALPSRVVLPPVSHLLGELGMLSPERYAPGPVLPQLRLPEEPVVARTSGARDEGMRDEGTRDDEKRPTVRKIYVACDFCRGRKLRCDGGRPRCSNCETRSLACKYQEHPRRRGPGKAPKGSRRKKAGRKSAGDPDMAGPSGVP